jgi:hypothetical protein
MATSVVPDRWKVSYVTPIFKKGRRINIEDYRGVEILSAIPKHFERLLYREFTTTWLHEEPIDDNEPIEICIFRAEFN